MIKFWSQKMAKTLVVNGIIDAHQEYELYVYGFETFIASSINVLSILMLSYLSGQFLPTIAFLMAYCVVRQYSGGYHASSHINCYLTFMSIYLFTSIVNRYIAIEMSNVWPIFCLIISICVIFRYAPLENRNNLLNKAEKLRYKYMARGISIIFGCIGGLILFYPYTKIHGLYIIAALSWIAILLIIGRRKEMKQ